MGRRGATAEEVPHAYYRELLERLAEEDARDRDDVQRLKIDLCKRHGVKRLPTNADVLARCTPEERERFLPILRMKPTRSISGVTIVTVQSSPAACPHGKCTYCPGGPEYGTAQSYTGDEPAARRAARHGFDAYAQTAGRLSDLTVTGHPVDKVDYIIQGGTFPARDPEYQEAFVLGAFRALNDHGNPGREPLPTLEAEQAANESAKARMIGLTIETKPDWARAEDCDLMLRLGCTRVELGVQTLEEDILRITHRGHTLADTVEAFRAVKDAGLKLCAHVMPGQPGSDYGKDLRTLDGLWEDPRFRPDMLKIYPTLVIRGTSLFRQMEAGKYEPVTEDYCVRLLADAKERFPEYVRVQRVNRDIPAPRIESGVKQSNLRELVHEELERRGKRCRCIRCREAGHRARKDGARVRRLDLRETRYEASGGVEHFLQLEDPDADVLAGFVRLREPSPLAHRPEAEGSLFLRELKVFGQEVAIGAAPHEASQQHRGLGARLLQRAEDVARERGLDRVVVTSGVGVRGYYRKHGYETLGPYVAKRV